MNAINGNPLNMSVQAIFTDVNNKGVETSCELNLNLFQQGPPLLVWGTGCHEVNPSGTSPITKNNYYYSLTYLQASGTIKIGNEEIKVSGLTWMDHEYGAFPQGSPTSKVIWLLQDIQLENGLHLSNYTKFGVYPEENVPMSSNATLLIDGKSHFIKTITTPLGPLFVSDKGVTYFLKFKIKLEGHDQLSFIVDSSYGDQVFRDGEGADVYEGVGTAELIYDLTQKEKIVLSKGTAWIEQNLG
ncbi:hypothetical protein ASG22_14695 [Chryseobacterium sp. Leaf405]|nr:hypothetical protein ASG22_14695 [Chryseobacterium sp. Leaf405]